MNRLVVPQFNNFHKLALKSVLLIRCNHFHMVSVYMFLRVPERVLRSLFPAFKKCLDRLHPGWFVYRTELVMDGTKRTFNVFLHLTTNLTLYSTTISFSILSDISLFFNMVFSISIWKIQFSHILHYPAH
jgi:hypothetical protein